MVNGLLWDLLPLSRSSWTLTSGCNPVPESCAAILNPVSCAASPYPKPGFSAAYLYPKLHSVAPRVPSSDLSPLCGLLHPDFSSCLRSSLFLVPACLLVQRLGSKSFQPLLLPGSTVSYTTLSRMASADLREELKCSICLDMYRDPVTLSCGHSFCRGCVRETWDSQAHSGVYSCPDCRKGFPKRPKLQRNWKLCNVVKCYLSTHTKEEETAAFCTYCLDFPSPAVRLCLQCETLLCEVHLQRHNERVAHVLTEPTISLEGRRCSAHKEVLKYYCAEDDSFLCVSCCIVGQHKTHQVQLLSEASGKKKLEMEEALEKLTVQSDQTNQDIDRLQRHSRAFRNKAETHKANITALFSDIKVLLAAREREVLQRVAAEEAQALSPVSADIQEMENKKDGILVKIARLQELRAVQDPLTLLKECKPSDISVDDGADDGDDDNDDDDRDNDDEEEIEAMDTWISLTLITVLQSFVDMLPELKAQRGFTLRGAADITLDVHTASVKNGLNVSHDLKAASQSDTKSFKSVHRSTRFVEYPQVMSSQNFSAGQHYWEVETSEIGSWAVGVTYPSIERAGSESGVGLNAKSWCLDWDKECLTAQHNSENEAIDEVSVPRRVGLYLDYEGGVLSFYQVTDDSLGHLHTFTTAFNEPLYPVFYANDEGWVKIRNLGC